MVKLFQSFLAKMKAGFRRISRQTRDDVPVEDLENDAFVLALEIGERRGRMIDFADPADQELVMRALHVEKVKRGDWKMRRAVRLDHSLDEDDEGDTLKERLPAAAVADPLVSLLDRESAVDVDAKLAERYSQATAYAITFSNFKNDRQKVCMHLVISGGTLARRVAGAIHTVKVQPSMFDRVERIPSDFVPLRGTGYADVNKDMRQMRQQAWDFDVAT